MPRKTVSQEERASRPLASRHAEHVIDGTITASSFFGYIRAAGANDDWTDPEVWRKANPSFGITLDAQQFAEDCQESQQSPRKESAFRRYRLNHGCTRPRPG